MRIIYRPTGRAREFSYLAINHYKGCGHRCEYCYSPNVTHNPDFFTKHLPKPAVLENVRKDAPQIAGTDERVLLCFATDPYQPLNDELGLTREILKILRANDVPFQILTKGGMRAVPDFDLYGQHDAFATTLTFLDVLKSKQFEPGAATPEDRILAILLAKKRGIETWVSLEPVLDAEQSLEIIRRTHNFVDLYKIGKLNYRQSKIQWRRFGIRAIKLCREYSKNYYIKDDLARFLDGFPFTNTDTRRIKR